MSEQIIEVEYEIPEREISLENENVRIAPNMQVKQVSPSDETQLVTADEGYIGLAGVTVDSVTEKLQDKQIAPTNSPQVVTADEGYLGLSSVTVNGFADDPNFKSENIKKHVTINGVTGTYSSAPDNVDSGVFWINPDDDGYYQDLIAVNLQGNMSYITANKAARVKHIYYNQCEKVTSIGSFYNNSYIELVDFRETSATQLADTTFWNAVNLKSLFFSDNFIRIGTAAIRNVTMLEFVDLGKDFNATGADFSASTKYSVETIIAMFEALADRTETTAYTLTLGSTNLNKLTAEQRQIATNKNWTLA